MRGEPSGRDVARDRPSQVSSTQKLEGEEEYVSADRKYQNVEGREDDHERETESEIRLSHTSSSHTVKILGDHTSKSVTLADDGRINEDAHGAGMYSPSLDAGSKVSPSGPGGLQDPGTNHIQSGCERQSVDVDTISLSSMQISNESSEVHIQRQSGEEVNSSLLVRASLALEENNATPAQPPRKTVENKPKSPSVASNNLRNPSLPEDTCTIGQTSSSAANLKGGSCGQIVGRDLPTQLDGSSTLNIEHDKAIVSADCMHQALEDRGDYHARETESEITLTSESYSSASSLRSVRQSESSVVLSTGRRTDEDTDRVVSSLSSSNAGHKLSLSEPDVPHDAVIDRIKSACEHRSSGVNLVSTTVVQTQTSSHHSIEGGDQSSPLVTIQGRPCDQDMATDQPGPCQRFFAPKLDDDESAECVYQAVENRGGRHEREMDSGSYSESHTVMIGEQSRSTSERAVLTIDRRMHEDTDVTAFPPSSPTALSSSDPGVPQDAGTGLVWSVCEHQSSEVDTIPIPMTLTQTPNHRSTESEGYIGRQPAQPFSCSDEPGEPTLYTDVSLSLAHEQNTSTSTSSQSLDITVESSLKSNSTSNEIRNLSFAESTVTTGQSPLVANVHGELCDRDMARQQRGQGSSHLPSPSTPKSEADKENVSADRIYTAVEGRGEYRERELEREVKLNMTSDLRTVRSFSQFTSETTTSDDDIRVVENVGNVVLSPSSTNTGLDSDVSPLGPGKYASGTATLNAHEDTDDAISPLAFTNTGPKLSNSKPCVPQDAGSDYIQSARRHRSSEVNTFSTTIVRTSRDQSVEKKGQTPSPASNMQRGLHGQDMARGRRRQRSFASEFDGDEKDGSADGISQPVEGSECHHERAPHSNTIGISRQSTSETVVLSDDRRVDEKGDVCALSTSSMTAVSNPSPSDPQDVRTSHIQSGCEHQSSGIDTASMTVVQTSNHDCSAEREGCIRQQSAQSFSCSEAAFSSDVCLSLEHEQNNSNSPGPFDKVVENVQKSSLASNEIRKSDVIESTLTTSHRHSLVAGIHGEPCGQDMTRDQPRQGSPSPGLGADEEGVPQDAGTNPTHESECECQSSEANVVSKTSKSEQTWSHQSSDSSEGHAQQRSDRQQTDSFGIVVLQVEESNTTLRSLDNVVDKSSPTPNDLQNSPLPEGTSTIGQTPLSGAYLQDIRDLDVARDRYTSQGSSVPKSEDKKVVLVSAGTVHQDLVPRGDHHERETESDAKLESTSYSAVGILTQSRSDTTIWNNDRRVNKDADGTVLPLSSTTTRSMQSNSELDIPQDASTTCIQSECVTQSSKVIAVSTTSIQTSNRNSTVSSERVHRQLAQTFSCGDESAFDYKVNQSQATASVRPFLAPRENNSTLVQPFDVTVENTHQSSLASNAISNPPLPVGASTIGQTSPAAIHACMESCGQNVARNPPSYDSSVPRLQDVNEETLADCTCQANKGAVSFPSSPNSGSKLSPSELPSISQDAGANHVQFRCERHSTQDTTVLGISVQISSDCLTNSREGCTYLDNPPHQSNNPSSAMHDGPHLPPPAFHGVHDSCNCSCMSPLIASLVSNEGDSTVTSAVVQKSISSDYDCPAQCAEGTASVKPRCDYYTHAEPAIISTRAVDQCCMSCDSNTIQTSSQEENQDSLSYVTLTTLCLT
ncbi:hypothetical protein DEU56DRAFT_138120 [Suillus clintonianus]|uniref:uncharacterized protein n=1 Tax=Suillus clintonianus TaxID=1904413 RepID=UPI001B875541|nr:uncharacterized protein DEU56DRAFT_138120 [Suillus clintonianus]KAG2118627.1 hypothetical protein DEU56DRAFT_138120 [Suillus clintonianus]